jgi:hypothetical protein
MAYYPPNGSAKELIMDADVQLDYPYSANINNVTVADIIEVIANVSNLKIILPNATESGPGFTITFNNIGVNSINVVLFDGTTALTTLAAGDIKTVYISDGTTSNGVWRVLGPAGGSNGINNLVVTSTDNSIDITGSPISNPGGTIDITLPPIIGKLTDLSSLIGGLVVYNPLTSPDIWSVGVIAGDSNITVENGDGTNFDTPIVIKLDNNIAISELKSGNIIINNNTVSNIDVDGFVNINSNGTNSLINLNAVQIDRNRNITNINNIAVTGTFISPNTTKAWCRFTNTTGTIVMTSSYNVSSVTLDSNNSQYTITFTTPLSTTEYAVGITCANNNSTSPLQTRIGYDIIRTVNHVVIVLADVSGEMLADLPEGVSVTIYSN